MEKLRTGLPSKTVNDGNDIKMIELLNAQKSNGNLTKARELGSVLAAEVASSDGEFIFGLDNKEDYTMIAQRRLLLAFTISKGLELFSPNSIISKTALSCFYDIIKSNSPHIYEDIRENGAFSYYLLFIRDNQNGKNFIGHTFAMLCGKEDDEIYAELGEALYLHFLDVVYQKISLTKFE